MIDTSILDTADQAAIDLALDFVEQELGANRFVSNWARVKSTAVDKIAAWLKNTKTDGDAAAIAAIIDALAAEDTQWLTPYTATVPYDESVQKLVNEAIARNR